MHFPSNPGNNDRMFKSTFLRDSTSPSMARPNRSPYQVARALSAAQYVLGQGQSRYSIAKKMNDFLYEGRESKKELSRTTNWLREFERGHNSKPNKEYILALSYALSRRKESDSYWKLDISLANRFELAKVIRRGDGYDIKFDDQSDLSVICNQLSRLPNYYDLWRKKNRTMILSEEVEKLVKSTRNYRRRDFTSLTETERRNIRKLNWLIFKSTYGEYLKDPFFDVSASNEQVIDKEIDATFRDIHYFVFACKLHFLPLLPNKDIKYHNANWYVEVRRDPLFFTHFLQLYECLKLEDIAIDIAESLTEDIDIWKKVLPKLVKSYTTPQIITLLEEEKMPLNFSTAFYILADYLVYQEILRGYGSVRL